MSAAFGVLAAAAPAPARGPPLGTRRRASSSPSVAFGSRPRGASSSACRAFTPAGAKIAGVGMSVPAQFLTNDDLASLVDTNDEWIRTRTGIGKRHVISGDETLTSLAAEASAKALEMAGVNARDVDLVLLATSSPDDAFGSALSLIHI